MRKLLPFLLITALAACAHMPPPVPEPVIVTQKVEVPVAVACVPPNLGGPPAYVDTDTALKSAKDGADRYRLLAAGRKQRVARQGQTEPVIDGCRKAGAAHS